jgi:hypothetical protein
MSTLQLNFNISVADGFLYRSLNAKSNFNHQFCSADQGDTSQIIWSRKVTVLKEASMCKKQSLYTPWRRLGGEEA